MKKPVLMKQKNMNRVLLALTPLLGVCVYYFGWRVAAMLAVALGTGFITEWIMASRRNGRVSTACFVTCALYALSLSATVPLPIVAVGAVVAILFGKEAFGGFGKNVFNPAIVGRGFVFVCFPVEITARYVPVFHGFPGGFAHWSMESLERLPGHLQATGLTVADAVTAATPMWARRDFGYETPVTDLFTGRIGGLFETEGVTRILAAGSNIEVCTLALMLAGVYLLWTRTANWRLTGGMLAGATGATLLFRYAMGIAAVPPPAFTLSSGALMFAAVFMVTDPVSAPKKKPAQWVYAALIGTLVVFFRYRSIFTGGVVFSILIGNMCAPTLDRWAGLWMARRGSDAK
jgi:Na+-transporting NADH:ubiquinone oxidoreductase subunit B